MTATRVRSYLGHVVLLALAVRLVGEVAGADRHSPVWTVWAILIGTTIGGLALAWAWLTWCDRRRLAGGSRALVAPWAVPLVGVLALVGGAVLAGQILYP